MKTTQLKKLITAFSALLIVSIGFWACRKQDFLAENNGYQQDATFFKRNDSLTGQFEKINGNLTDELLLNKLIDEFKAYDKEKQIAEGIKEKYGKPQWDISIVLKNENGFRTIASPILSTNNEVTAMGLFYQTSGTTFDFKIVSRKTKQTNLPEFGDKAATKFTRASLLGLFQVADNNTANATLLKQNVDNNYTTHGVQTQGINYSYVCWNYSSYHQRADGIWEYTFTSMQCSLSIVFTADAMPKVQEIGEEGGSGRIGGGGGGSTLRPAVKVDSVDIKVKSSCLESTLSKITADSNKLKSEITRMYNDTYVGTDKKFNLLIQEISATQTGAKAESYRSNTSLNTWEIYLDGRFANSLTQEKWGSIILHELVHGFIDMNDLDFKDYSNLTDAHKKMLDSWIIQIKETLVKIYGIPEADALALSLEGFDDVLKVKVGGVFKADMKIWMQNKYQVNLEAAQELAQKYTSGDKGKKCN